MVLDSCMTTWYPGLRSRVERILCSDNIPNANFGRELLIESRDQIRDSWYLVDYFDGYNVPGCVYPGVCTRCTLDVHLRLSSLVRISHAVIRESMPTGSSALSSETEPSLTRASKM